MGDAVKAVILILAVLFAGCTRVDYSDDSDDRLSELKSGMVPRTDFLTGCQYLTVGEAITPRMDANGKQICKKKED